VSEVWPTWGEPAEQAADEQVPTAVSISSGEARVGTRVRIWPSARADAFDVLMEGKTGRVEAIKQDYEGRLYLVVTLDEDPGREQPDERVWPGHRFFFFAEELELVEATS
jgi:hypothetical protein